MSRRDKEYWQVIITIFLTGVLVGIMLGLAVWNVCP